MSEGGKARDERCSCQQFAKTFFNEEYKVNTTLEILVSLGVALLKIYYFNTQKCGGRKRKHTITCV